MNDITDEVFEIFEELQSESPEFEWMNRPRDEWFRAAEPKRWRTPSRRGRMSLLERAAEDAARWKRVPCDPPRERVPRQRRERKPRAERAARRPKAYRDVPRKEPKLCRICGVECRQTFCSTEHRSAFYRSCLPPADSYYVRSGQHTHDMLDLLLPDARFAGGAR